MRVLITGGAGFIGSHLADRLIGDGDAVYGVDNYTTGRKENWPADEPRRLFDCDIVDRKHLYSLANAIKPDVVIHCAASYSDPNLWHRDTDTNVAGTINAINVARHHGAKLVYFQTALPPISSYAISKIAGEQYIALSGVPHLIFRLANIYGPRNLSGPIPTFYKRLAAGQECTVVKTRRDMVFIDDLVALVTSAIAEDAAGKYDVCSGGDYWISELYESVAKAMGVDAAPTQIPAPADDVFRMSLDPGKAWEKLGWTPKTRLPEGVAKAVDWYRENGVADTYTHLNLKG